MFPLLMRIHFCLAACLPLFLVMIVLFNISVMIYSRVCVSYGKLEDCICLGLEAAGELTLGLCDSLKCTYFSYKKKKKGKQ